MRQVVLGSLIGAALVLFSGVLRSEGDEVYGQHPAHNSSASAELIAFTTAADDSRVLLTVIDPRQRVVSVYHVHRESGKISLLSVRNIHWDLQIQDFNGANPLPEEIRKQLQQR